MPAFAGGFHILYPLIPDAGSVPERLRPMVLASTKGGDPNCADAEDSAGALTWAGIGTGATGVMDAEANDGDGSGARGGIMPFIRGEGTRTPLTEGECIPFIWRVGDNDGGDNVGERIPFEVGELDVARDSSALPPTISFKPSSSCQARTPPTRITGMLRRTFLNSSSYTARIRAFSAGDSPMDFDASSQTTTASN